jgi:hypothetical protein
MKCYDVTTDGLDNPTRKIIWKPVDIQNISGEREEIISPYDWLNIKLPMGDDDN